jgi:putative nucleotidyltransferase with HDIG domain
MKPSQVIYRARQFWMAWRGQSLTEDELEPAISILTAEQMQLFTRLQASEQIHAMRVLQTVQQQGAEDIDLYTAALLHDIGKIRAPLRLWERVLIVIAKNLFPKRVRTWGNGPLHSWMRPFVIAEQHPAWGAEMAFEVGCSAMVVSMIRRHQYPDDFEPVSPREDHVLKILQNADHKN